MSRVSSILRNVDSISANKNDSKIDYEKLKKLSDEHEEYINKDEATRKHERYLNYIKRHSEPMELKINPHRTTKEKPGLVFEGNLKKLAEKYKTIEEIFKHMTLGQLAKHYEKDGKIYELPDNKMVYDPTKE